MTKIEKRKIQPPACAIYFVPEQTAERYHADFFSADGTFIESLDWSIDSGDARAFLEACLDYAWMLENHRA